MCLYRPKHLAQESNPSILPSCDFSLLVLPLHRHHPRCHSSRCCVRSVVFSSLFHKNSTFSTAHKPGSRVTSKYKCRCINMCVEDCPDVERKMNEDSFERCASNSFREPEIVKVHAESKRCRSKRDCMGQSSCRKQRRVQPLHHSAGTRMVAAAAPRAIVQGTPVVMNIMLYAPLGLQKDVRHI